MTTILDGKALSKKILEDLTQKVSLLERKPHLAVILVGDNEASKLYVGMKEKRANNIGIQSEVITYPQNTTEDVVLEKINELNQDDSVDAILVQMPLPEHIDSHNIIEAIDPKKDVDSFTIENAGKIATKLEPYCYPCTPTGIIRLLDEYNIEIEGKNVVIVGRSNIVGHPMAQMMLNRNATVTICHSRTKNLKENTLTADILISAVGKAKLITKDMVKNGAVVVDVGTSKFEGKLCGDVDFENVKDLTSYISPVPGGVGPMTIASLMMNTYLLAQKH